MEPLPPPDSHHLNAAIGWLGLGCPNEARDELLRISYGGQIHPEVLEVRWTLCAHDERWEDALIIADMQLKAAPEDASGWLHRAYALRRVKTGGLARAWESLLPAAEKFPKESIIAYNLSCYACQLQQMDQARNWFYRALAAGNSVAIKKMALDDADLEPLWAEVKKM